MQTDTPTPTQALEPVEVTQAARDVVAAYWMPPPEEQIDHLPWVRRANAAAQGLMDDDELVQAFARFERDTIERHRQSSNAASVGVEAFELFDMGYVFGMALRGQNLEDSRAVGRLLMADSFRPIRDAIDAAIKELSFDSFQSADSGICQAKSIVRHALASLSTPNAASVVGRMGTALDVADRLIERGYGIDVPQEWHDEMREVAEARASLSTPTAEPMAELQRLGQEYDGDALREAATALLEGLSSTYTARNGREVGIQGDDGEKCYIVHSDFVFDLRRALSATPPAQEGGSAAEERDALLSAMGWKTGPFASESSRKVILDDAAGLRPEMVKARRRAQDAEADRDLWRWIAGEVVHGSRSGVLARVWKLFKEERSRRRQLERDAQASALATPAPTVDETDRLRAMDEAPKDGRYVMAVYRSLNGYAESLNGRAFVVRHEGKTDSGYDLGWSLFPGHGGVPDKCFFGWMPLPRALSDRPQTEGEVK